MLAREKYQQAIEIALEAKNEKNSGIIVEKIPDIGVEIVGEKNYMGLKCIYTAEDGSCIKFNYHSYDPSGPFQNLPDVNKIKIELFQDTEKIEECYMEFDDPR
ncbi:MAG: hypothetical protein HGA59_04285 [Chlorobiaceae bacterium]|nr:hypothetical protein [Chlorobiaceae bacterium]NTV59866.1 hypothetical protein [Chlorobiaceae bacterium]